MTTASQPANRPAKASTGATLFTQQCAAKWAGIRQCTVTWKVPSDWVCHPCQAMWLSPVHHHLGSLEPREAAQEDADAGCSHVVLLAQHHIQPPQQLLLLLQQRLG